jgi:ABC-2 type transport system permease protein
VFFFIANYLAAGCTVGVRLFFSIVGYGIDYNDTPDIFFLRVLSPISFLMSQVGLSSNTHYDSQGMLVAKGLSYSGGIVVLGYVFAAVLIYVLSYYSYRRRQSESAGDLLAFSWLKPVFRWGAGLCAGYLAGILVASLSSKFPIWVGLVVFGLLAFFVADMFVQKTFRVFTRKRFRECVLFLGFVAVSYGGMYGATYGVEQYVPEESQLAGAYLYMNYPVEFTGEQLGEAIRMHEEILSRSGQLRELVETEAPEDVIVLSFIYQFTNGKKLERLYQLPSEDEFCLGLTETLYSYEMEPDSFMRYLIGSDYADIRDFEEAAFEYESEDGSYTSHMLEPREAVTVYRALCADAEAGTLQKYNLSNFYTPDAELSEEESSVYLYFKFLHTSEDWEDAFDVANGLLLPNSVVTSYTSEEDNLSGYLNVAFGEDCTNIIDALCDLGVIGSPDELVFEEEE